MTTGSGSANVETFPPSEEFAADAVAQAEKYERANSDRIAYWAEQARSVLHWDEDFTQTLDWSDAPFAKWFVGGKLNAAYNCVDRHVDAGNGDRVAIYFEGEPGDTRTLTYKDMADEVARAANAFESLGVTKGDRVAIYMPMIPETVISMLACARIGAIHSVVFGGFSADALRSRIDDAEAKLVVTVDGSYRRGKPSPLKTNVDTALSAPGHTVENVLVVQRNGEDVAFDADIDVWWHDLVPQQSSQHTYVAHDAEHPLFILYTSGTTGKPKGILHTTGGYLTENVVHPPGPSSISSPSTDVYLVLRRRRLGHRALLHPLRARWPTAASQIMYEGTPDTPHKGRLWEIVEKYRVTQLYSAPTLIRTCMKWGREFPDQYDLSSLRVLGTVGEPINPEAWMWYREVIGSKIQGAPGSHRGHLVADRNRCPHDQPAARCHRHQARLGPEAGARHRGRRR